MTKENRDRKELDPEQLRKLAAEIADQIVTGAASDLPIAEILAATRKCPEGNVCCFNRFKCKGDLNFWCTLNFRCSGGFIGSDPHEVGS